jgi:anti-sigma factor ChrR (cupin superfamily)
VQLSHERAENPLGSITADRVPESLADDNSDSTGSVIHLVRQQIEQPRRDTPTMTLDPVDILACS